MKEPIQLTLGLEPAHRNQYLFSDHYLNNLLPDDPRWAEGLPGAEAFLGWLQELYAREQAQIPHYNEPQLEDRWFKPILTELGHTFEGQASVPGLNAGIKRPDFVFFPHETARQAAVSAQKTAEYVGEALAVGEVKRWDVPLGKKQVGGGASFEAQNPSWQIDYYLRATGLDWGILSNGRRWRLVHRDTSQRLSIYYEVDLVDLLSRDDPRAMRYFTLFFQQGAFRPDAQGRIFLGDVLAASNAYAVALEEDLERNVYRALEKLMQGFLDLPANRLGADDLREIYDNSLYLLYRLLFILYAESRGLLPLEKARYRDHYSLWDIKGDIARGEMPTSPRTTVTWARLHTLFHIINGDDPNLNRELGVPRYNGGLFNPNMHPFLEQKAVGDRELVEAIDLICRRTIETGREFVDYRSLGVRHLGSIYEGLLEYQPRYAAEPTVAVRDGKGERWVVEERSPKSAEPSRVLDRREPGQVYLETDRGERKATGSYYTPQYIVAYIVENTLGPLVEEAVTRVKKRAREAKGKAARAEAAQSLANEILSLKVLDPAMGSGHFLVEATEFLALALATDPYVETEAPAEEDLIHWRRRVVERCIYGVDKNPLAVELAKLSLWLATVAADKPLSFLDHHLKCGDSLVGAQVANLGWAPPAILSKKARQKLEEQKATQANMFEYLLSQKLPVVLGKVLEITGVESDSYETVQAKEAADRAVQQLKAPFEAVADLWVSAHFGHEFTAGEYDEALGLIGQPDKLLALDAVARARLMAVECRFFHWELGFPEVFYDLHGQPLHDRIGFDVVIGNPPWRGRVDKTEYQYLKARFASIHQRLPDTAKYFIGLAHDSIRGSGSIGQILPNVVLYEHEYTNVRSLFLENYDIRSLINLGDGVFGDVTAPCCIVIVGISDSPQTTKVEIRDLRHLSRDSLPFLDGGISCKIEQDSLRMVPDFVVVGDVAGLQLLTRLYEVSHKIVDLASSISLGVHTGCNAAFILTRSEAEEEGIEDDVSWSLLVGEDIDRYTTPERPPNVVLYLEWDFDEATHPRTIAHLDKYKKQLESRREARQGKMPWYALHWPRYRGLYCSPKVICRQTSDTLVATVDPYGHCVLNSIIVIRPDAEVWSPFLWVALLNSKLLRYVYNLLVQEGSRTFAEVKPVNLRKLPIRRIEFITPASERQNLAEDAEVLYLAYLEHGEDAEICAFVAARLEAKPEQADVIHDFLAFLAEQMIDLHKRKQANVETFWLDLEGVADAGAFDVLRNKGKWESTLWKSAACRPFVVEDSRSTRTLVESLGWDEEAFKAFVKALVGRVTGLSDMIGVYRTHSPMYREVVRCIEMTDRLIDRIVYQLYGLTEEEIAIVEGR